jgi:glutathione S-transferase
MNDLTLYIDGFWISPYAFSAFVALKEKGLPFEVKEVPLDKKEHHRPEYRDHSLTGRVPALRHGDYWLSESSAIAEYLAETFPFPKYPRLFPENLQERGRARQIQAWIRSDLMPIREERSTSSIFYANERAKAPLSPEGEEAAARLLRLANQLIREDRTTLFDAWCIADTDLALMIQRLNVNGYPLPAKVKAYAEAQWRRPSVHEWVDHPRRPFAPY